MAQALPTHATPEQSAATCDAIGMADATAAPDGVALAPVKPPDPESAEPAKRSPARYLWAMLIARICEVFPQVCPLCAGQMRIIAFIVDGAEVLKILEHIGVGAQAPRITPARRPPLWDECDAEVQEGVGVELE